MKRAAAAAVLFLGLLQSALATNQTCGDYDCSNSGNVENASLADEVVDGIKKAGGEAKANKLSVASFEAGEEIVNDLVDSGYQVVLFDNRDTGDSEKLDRLGRPNLYWKFFLSSLGFDFSAPYTLNDMANDGVALLEYLDIDEAHIVGASMGGMIAQIIAANYPEKTKRFKVLAEKR